ncbi:hypothetical protein WG66_008818 [Moniliophthora roreri]|nr:hypothetical protein WG66_008818 [Moniliophthora roreri]
MVPRTGDQTRWLLKDRMSNGRLRRRIGFPPEWNWIPEDILDILHQDSLPHRQKKTNPVPAT